MARDDIVDLSESGRQLRTIRRQRWIRVALPIAFILILGFALAAVLYFNHHANRRDALMLTDDVIRTVADRIETEVVNYLSPAKQTVELASKRSERFTLDEIKSGVSIQFDHVAEDPASISIDGPAPLQFEGLGVDVLTAYSQLAMLNIADIDGNFVMPKKMPDGRIDTKIIDRRGGEAKVQWVRRDAAGRVGRIEPVGYDGYDPRERPWYEGAVRNDGLFWTDIYILFTDRKPGVTAAHPMYSNEGALLGVLGVDIELDVLCAYLASLSIGESGRAVIIDDNGRVVAYPEMEKTMRSAGENLRPVVIEELSDPAITRAYNRFRIEGPGTYEFALDGVRHRGSAVSLPPDLGTSWHILIVVPEQDFVGFVGKRTRSTARISIAVLGVLALLVASVVATNVRTDRRAIAALEAEQELDRAGSVYLELSNDPGLMDAANHDSLQNLTAKAAEAARVQRVSVWEINGSDLICLDAYDRTSQGHVGGMTLDLRCMPGLRQALDDRKAVVEIDVAADGRLRELDDVYLRPLQHESVIFQPVAVRGEPRGMLMFEGSRHGVGWSKLTQSLATSLSILLSVRFADHATPPRSPAKPETVKNAPDQPLDPSEEALAPPEPSVSLDRSGLTALEVKTVPEASVLVIKAAGRESSETLGSRDAIAVGVLHQLACLVDSWASERDAALTVHSGDGVIVANDVADESEGSAGSGLNDLAHLALALQRVSRELDKDDAVAVTMGLDQGEVEIARLGHSDVRPQILGPATRVATQLAQQSTGDAVQVSERSYERLRQRFILQPRGRFYAPGIGSLGIYFLNGELENAR